MVDFSSHRAGIIAILIAINGTYFLSKNKGKNSFGYFELTIPDVICFSPTQIFVPLEELSLSSAVLVLICSISHWLRKGIDQYVKDSLIKILLKEAVAAADLCGCCFELIIVADNFGVWVYGLYLFLLTIWWSKDWNDVNACPNVQLKDAVLGKQDFQLALMKIWAQLTGGILVFRFVQYVWSLELIETHKNRAFEDCTADLQVSIWHGLIIEGGGTLACQLASKFIAEIEPKYGIVIESFIGTALVVAAFDWTGGYFNPALATALKLGCEGNTFKEHVLVYWVGGCLGSVISIPIYHNSPLKFVAQKIFGNSKNPIEQQNKGVGEELENNGFWDKSD